MMAALEAAGAQVQQCHWPLFSGVEEKLRVSRSNWALLFVLLRLMYAWTRLTFKFARAKRPDVVIVGYGGLGDVLLARLLTCFRPAQIVYDAFLSNYDVTVNDRQLCHPGSLKARMLWRYDSWMCRLADMVLLDTESHWRYFVQEFGLPPEKFARAFIGTDKQGRYTPKAMTSLPARDDVCRVVFWGTFIPVHGLDAILGAAEQLRDDPRVEVTLIGGGQLEETVRRRIAALDSPRIRLLPRMSYDELVPCIQNADICLGTFGASAKAQRVIPCKVFECLYFGKPFVTADTPGARELLEHQKNAWLVPANDADALASALIQLAVDPALRARLAGNACLTYNAACSHERIGSELVAILTRLTGKEHRSRARGTSGQADESRRAA
ncbi:MAG: glycosyltransferase [Planctomycetales bacterium]|nr:glycosyltransferase [Planctomycetales bacterium]